MGSAARRPAEPEGPAWTVTSSAGSPSWGCCPPPSRRPGPVAPGSCSSRARRASARRPWSTGSPAAFPTRVLRASGDEAETVLAYGAVGQLGRSAGAPAAELLARNGPEGVAGLDPLTVGARLLDLLGRLQADGPVLLVVVDDVDLVDPPSLRALLFVLRRPIARPGAGPADGQGRAGGCRCPRACTGCWPAATAAPCGWAAWRSGTCTGWPLVPGWARSRWGPPSACACSPASARPTPAGRPGTSRCAPPPNR
jgi:hypothetical protein